MTERPIISSGPMVRATLDDRKTATRRVMVPQPPEDCGRLFVGEFHPTRVRPNGEEYPGPVVYGAYTEDYDCRCPYGRPGDRLWVREGWKTTSMSHHTPTHGPESVEYTIAYRAGNGIYPHCRTVRMESPVDNAWQRNRDGWRPSIHMPRWASRIDLEVTAIRAERVQEISDMDILAEGLLIYGKGSLMLSAIGAGMIAEHKVMSRRGFLAGLVAAGLWCEIPGQPDSFTPLSRRAAYAALWDAINAGRGYPWASNPMVWVIEFRRLHG